MSDGARDAENALRSKYGTCPVCGEPGITRERRINGYTTCAKGHHILSREWDDQQPKRKTDVEIPTVGRIVRYVSYGTPGGEHKSTDRAAIVTETGVSPDGAGTTISLCVLNPTGMFFNEHVPCDTHVNPRGGTWHWPPRG